MERSARREAEIAATSRECWMKLMTSWRRLASWVMILSEFAFRSRIVRFSEARIRSAACELAERRRAESDRLVQVLRVAGQRGPELVDQEREPVLVGLAQGVLDQVGLDRLR